MDLTSVKSMLEVGSGSGEFLDHFRAINQEAVIYSKEPSHRMAVLQKLFSVEPIMCYYLDEWSEYNKVRLDLVVSFETLEHLADPLRELRAIGESLNKDGRLFFSVPNGTYFHAKSRLLGIAPPSSHFYHFTPRSLRYICETANLKVRRIDAMKRIFEAKRSTRLKQAAMEIAYLAARAQLATTGSTPLSDSFLVECSRNTGA
jgi:SAM-dependent methyltransferase